MKHNPGRFYFSDKNGVEFAHELQGSIFEGTGAWCVVNGQSKKGYRTSITIFTGRTSTRTITCADFGMDEVNVKLWFPNDKITDKFKLVKGEVA